MRNSHTGDHVFKKVVVVDILALKYRHISKNGQQKEFSAKRPFKNGQKKPNVWGTICKKFNMRMFS